MMNFMISVAIDGHDGYEAVDRAKELVIQHGGEVFYDEFRQRQARYAELNCGIADERFNGLITALAEDDDVRAALLDTPSADLCNSAELLAKVTEVQSRKDAEFDAACEMERRQRQSGRANLKRIIAVITIPDEGHITDHYQAVTWLQGKLNSGRVDGVQITTYETAALAAMDEAGLSGGFKTPAEPISQRSDPEPGFRR